MRWRCARRAWLASVSNIWRNCARPPAPEGWGTPAHTQLTRQWRLVSPSRRQGDTRLHELTCTLDTKRTPRVVAGDDGPPECAARAQPPSVEPGRTSRAGPSPATCPLAPPPQPAAHVQPSFSTRSLDEEATLKRLRSGRIGLGRRDSPFRRTSAGSGRHQGRHETRILGRIGCSLITISAGGWAIPRYPGRRTGA